MTDAKLDRSPLVIEALSSPDAPYYVYLLIDPETDKPFYVGKGRGERFRSHGIEAAVLAGDGATAAEKRRKVARIQAIRGAGGEPRIAFARIRIPNEREAFLVEAALIDTLNRFGEPLVNEVRGHQAAAGLVSLEDLEREYGATEFTTLEPAILINLGRWWPTPDPTVPNEGHGYRADMTPEELYASARAWWRIGKRNYRYAVAVHNGITRAVWEIDPASWVSHQREGERVRWKFDGTPAPPDIHDAFVGPIGRRVPARRPDGRHVFGQSSAIAYWPE